MRKVSSLLRRPATRLRITIWFPQYPASYELECVISVASSNLADQFSIFSNFGRNSVDLGGAGPVPYVRLYRARSYGYLSGTSMASPHVAGAVALLHAAEPDLDLKELRERLFESVDRLPAFSGGVTTGGRLNLRRALGLSDLLATAHIDIPSARIIVLEPPIQSLELTGGLGTADAEAPVMWSKIEGPGPVEFSSPEGLRTSATFPSPGLYRIRFTVVSDHKASEDEITWWSEPNLRPQMVLKASGDSKRVGARPRLTVLIGHATES